MWKKLWKRILFELWWFKNYTWDMKFRKSVGPFVYHKTNPLKEVKDESQGDTEN